MPIQYPRTCAECGGVYTQKSNFSRHLKQGYCERKKTALINIQGQNVTVNNHISDNDVGTKHLQEQVKQLQLQLEGFQARANNIKLPLLDEDDEYIYVIQERIAMELLIPVYKVGVTAEIHRRSGQYAKGSKLIFCRIFKDARGKEKALHKYLQSKFKVRSDFGTEYIEGDINEIMNEIQTFLFIKPSMIDNNE